MTDKVNLLSDWLIRAPVVPLIQATDPDVAVETARALVKGGLGVIEVVFRTPEAALCLERIASEVDEALVGAGTVMTNEQADNALDSGARFVVSPGLNTSVVQYVRNKGIEMIPGVATPSEAMLAQSLGLRIVKFFPASVAGGPAGLSALSSVLPDLQFMPTGGISAKNLTEYLKMDCVIACGGSWLTPHSAIDSGDFSIITKLAADALRTATDSRTY